MRHGADWRNPAREAVRIVPFLGDLNHGKIQAGPRSPGSAGEPNACIAPAPSLGWKLFLTLGVPRFGLSYFYPSMAAVMSLTDLRVVFAALMMCSPALAHDNGQFGDVPDTVRAWFKAVKSHQGVPCCDIADGHPTDFDIRENQYWVPVNGTWMPVPPEAVIKDDGNPTGEAVVWYSAYGNQVYIRCFVPGDGA